MLCRALWVRRCGFIRRACSSCERLLRAAFCALPAREEAELPLKLEDGTRVLHVIGKAEVKGDELVLGAQSFAILG